MFFLFISISRSFIANYTLDSFFEKILLLIYVLKFHTEIRNNMSLLVAKVERLNHPLHQEDTDNPDQNRQQHMLGLLTHKKHNNGWNNQWVAEWI